MTASLPRQASPPDEPPRPPEQPGHRIRRRALTLLIIVLLIGVPAGYLVISANQSRDSGKDKEAKYSATGLTPGWPSRVQRRLYQVPIPGYSAEVAYYETNNWKTSRLYVQFLTSDEGLEKFLKTIGTSLDALEKDDIVISARDRRVVGWEFTGPGPWSGLNHARKNPTPSHHIVVDWAKPGHPMVYVVSRTTP
ncbi:sugar kinase [Streptomyces sp. NPDC057621]|uniref:Sugar kinase n=1 Tax=Streptomyces liliiviolaceus TaxID=2823109 RepID=A0A940Y4T0_9ACTN|nr:sugar kinase [Streptomyces liliiviolaceus]MBQ0852450.1 sugar kinase [Streptomyces liliiviolaceus]